VGLIVESAPRSPAAEAYRTARTSVLSLAGRRGAKVIAVLSPAQGEGKSTSAANLAAALGHADRRVVVVSADLRKPTIHKHFGVSPSKGLSEVLTGELSLEEAVRRSFSPNVWVLASGRIPAHPAELLQSPAMGQVIAELRETFDFVVIDCPPLLGLADSLAVVPLTDAILLVVQAERTQGGAIVEACDQLDRVGGRVEGVILNDIRAQRGWPGHRGYGYYLASTQYLASQEETMGTATTIRERTRSPFEERRAAAAQDAPLTAEPRSATTADDR
jgi:capsular exopolysaccharide synthesis family protein